MILRADQTPCGRVGERLKPADCKSAVPCGLRRFESSPVHHLSVRGHLERDCPTIAETERARLRNAARAALKFSAWVAQVVERVLGKDEVTGSIPVPGSSIERAE